MGRDGGKDRKTLVRIVALLCALAELAGHAAGSPRPIRVAVLWLLRAAESTAWHFVEGLAREAGVEPGPALPCRAHDIADDAARLARSFTALAERLAAIVRLCALPLPGVGMGRSFARLARAVGTLCPRPTSPQPDTS